MQEVGKLASRNNRNVSLPRTVILLGKEERFTENVVPNKKGKLMLSSNYKQQAKSMFKNLLFVDSNSKAGLDLHTACVFLPEICPPHCLSLSNTNTSSDSK